MIQLAKQRAENFGGFHISAQTWTCLAKWRREFLSAWKAIGAATQELNERWSSVSQLWIDQSRGSLFALSRPFYLGAGIEERDKIFAELLSIEREVNDARVKYLNEILSDQSNSPNGSGRRKGRLKRDVLGDDLKIFIAEKVRSQEAVAAKLRLHQNALQIFSVVNTKPWLRQFDSRLIDAERVITTLWAATQNIGSSVGNSPPKPDPHTQLLRPMTKTEMRLRLNLGPRAFNTFIKTYPLISLGRQLFQMRLDKMDSRTKEMLERPLNKSAHLATGRDKSSRLESSR